MIRDHHEGYIDWDRFEANRLRLAGNRTNGEVLSGPAREGLCLLQGVLICGACGRRLGIRYTGNGGVYPVYQCIWKHREALSPRACLSVPAAPLDQAITERLVGAITPVTIELALSALTSLEERDREVWLDETVRKVGGQAAGRNGRRAQRSAAAWSRSEVTFATAARTFN